MRKFRFRLEKLLDYRRRLEEGAKTAYLEARARRIDAEYDLQGLQNTRETTLKRGTPCLEGRLALDSYLSKLEDDQRAQASVIAVLTDEEEQFRQAWVNARQEAEALQKLRDKEYEDYKLEAARYEQAELDEWAVLRRAA